MKVKSESEVAQSCPTLSDPMDCTLPGSSIHGIFQARVLEWGAIAFTFYQGTTALIFLSSQVALVVKNLLAICETHVQSLGQEGPLEKEMTTHSSVLAWRIPWTEQPGGLQSMGHKEQDMQLVGFSSSPARN